MTPVMLNEAYSQMLKSGTSKNTVYHFHVFIHSVLAMAFKEGLIPRNYADAATPPKSSQNKVDFLSEEQLKAFYNILYSDTRERDYVYKVLFSLLLSAGCRIGELCALTWDDIDFNDNRIHICKHFVHDKMGRHVEEGCKTAAGERWLYMDDGTMEMLKGYRTYYYQIAKTYGSKWYYYIKAVFFSTHHPGDYMNPDTARTWLKNFTKANNLPDIRPHQFRHTAISLQLQAGISIPEAAKRAGHARPDVTLRTYSHALKENNRHCCEAVTRAMPEMPRYKTG